MILTRKITKRSVLYVASDKQGQTATVRIKAFPGSIEVGFGDIQPLREELVAAGFRLGCVANPATPGTPRFGLSAPAVEPETEHQLVVQGALCVYWGCEI